MAFSDIMPVIRDPDSQESILKHLEMAVLADHPGLEGYALQTVQQKRLVTYEKRRRTRNALTWVAGSGKTRAFLGQAEHKYEGHFHPGTQAERFSDGYLNDVNRVIVTSSKSVLEVVQSELVKHMSENRYYSDRKATWTQADYDKRAVKNLVKNKINDFYSFLKPYETTWKGGSLKWEPPS